MNYLVRPLFAVALVFLCSSLGFATPILINFDTDPSGSAVANGTVVDTLYASLGVTFQREGGTTCGPNIYASNNQPAGFGSAPNVVTTCAPPTASDINAATYGVIRVLLSRFATQVCIDVLPDNATGFATLKVYDSGDALLASASSAAGATQTLCAAALGIRGARFSGGSASAFARFDNLAVAFGGGPAPTATYYDGFTDFAAPVCSSAGGGKITTGLRTAVWNTPPSGAIETRVDSVNGVATFSPPSNASPSGSGTTQFGTFQAGGLGPYPFTYTFQFTTSVGGSMVSVSSASIHCVADGPGGTSFVLGVSPPALENPQPASFQSGIGVLSGWSCNGPYVAVAIDAEPLRSVPYGSARADTAGVCGFGNTDSGFGLLLNFNTLLAGSHSARLYVNGQALGAPATFTVTVPSDEFITGVSKSVTASDFPSSGRSTVLTWQQSQQNFAIQSTAP